MRQHLFGQALRVVAIAVLLAGCGDGDVDGTVDTPTGAEAGSGPTSSGTGGTGGVLDADGGEAPGGGAGQGGSLPGDDIIIDNTDPGFSSDSSWSTGSFVGGYYGDDYAHDGDIGTDPSRWARWTPTITTAGVYEVYMFRPAFPEYSSSAPVTVQHGEGVDQVMVDQRQSGAVWNLLGVFHFDAGTDGHVQISGDGHGYTIADAVRFRSPDSATPLYPPDPPGQIVVDNTDPGFTTDSPWFESTTVASYYGSNYLHDGTAGSDGADRWARWTPTITTAGTYEVFMRWLSYGEYPAQVPVTIAHGGGVQHESIDQTADGSRWISLGSYPFEAGSSGYVQLEATGHGYTIADAVRLVPEP